MTRPAVPAALVTYAHLAGASVRARAQYRLSFALDFAGAFLAGLTDFVVILVLFAHLPRLGGWSLPEIAFLYGVSGVSFAMTDMLLGHLDSFGETIRTGAFDVMLLRPLSSLYQAASAEFAIRRLGRVAQAASVLAYALSRLPVVWTPGRLLALALTLVCGTVIYSGIWIAGGSINFWTSELRELPNSFTYGGNMLTSYPLTIFTGWLRRLVTLLAPLAFVSYYPALLVLGRPDPLLGTPWLGLLTPGVAVATLLAGRAVWQTGVRRYRSTGS